MANLLHRFKIWSDRRLAADPADFAPPLLRLQIGLVAGIVLWAVLGRLDIVAVTDGKLVPSSYLKIVQPAEQGIVKEILVKEGETVAAGQVLIRMDSVLAAADVKSIQAEYQQKRIALRRIDAQLAGKKFLRESNDPVELALQIAAQYAANVRAHES